LTPIVPYAGVPDGIGLLVHIRATLDGSSKSAQDLYAKFVQEYAEQLASESARQEASARAPGAKTTEITESVVIRARESLDQQAARQQRPASFWEAAALAGTPILSGAAGVMGNNLHSSLQWATFALSSVGAVVCILYLLKRRLL
jgi:Flp pilus assembly protein TadB